jgi:hypothetical protein
VSHSQTRRITTWVIEAEPLLLALAVPVLVLQPSHLWRMQRGLSDYDALGDPALAWPSRLSFLALALIALPWLARWARDGSPLRRTPLDLPIGLYLATKVLGLWPSVDRAHSLTTLLGIVGGVALYYGAWHWGAQAPSRRIWPLVALPVLLGAGLAVLGLLQTDWTLVQRNGAGFLVPLHSWLSELPHVGERRIDPRGLDDAMIIVVPLAAAGLFAARGVVARLVLALAFLLTLTYVVAVWSRGDLLALALAALLVLVFQLRRGHEVALGLGAGAVAALTGVLLLSPGAASSLAERIYPSRDMVWTRALYIIEDHPFTGAGLDDFRPIARNSYPYFNIAYDQTEHAHSWPLQAGVDGGVLGVVSVFWLAGAFYVSAVRAGNRLSHTKNTKDSLSHTKNTETTKDSLSHTKNTKTTKDYTNPYSDISASFAISAVERNPRTFVPFVIFVCKMKPGFVAGFTAFFIGSLYDNGTMGTPRGALLLWLFLAAAMVALHRPSMVAPVARRSLPARWGVAAAVVCLVAGAGLVWDNRAWVQALYENNMACVARNWGLYTADMGDGQRANLAEQAVAGYQRAVAAAPELAAAHRNLGLLYWQASTPKESTRSIGWTVGLTAAPLAFFQGMPQPEGGFAAAAQDELDVALSLAPLDAVAGGVNELARQAADK